MEKNENENKEEKKAENTKNNNKKYIIPILIIVIIVLIGGICYLYMSIVSKDKNIADKENIIKKQQEQLLNAAKDKEKDKQDDKDKDKDKKENKSTEENKTDAKQKVEIMPETSKTRLLGLRDSSLKTLEKYKNEYRNSIIYGTIAYALHMLSLISIPVLIILLIVSYVYDSVIGLKTRSLYNKGRLIRFHVLTFFVACQLMPLIFATVIKGWGN